ncbi:hypothetical protein HMPREF0262_02547 [Clostridium sp. ATCC 29733]|nr:hypothetical protein HMPREF0262_02547 [Clostridium sp. ATCC 29733]
MIDVIPVFFYPPAGGGTEKTAPPPFCAGGRGPPRGRTAAHITF